VSVSVHVKSAKALILRPEVSAWGAALARRGGEGAFALDADAKQFREQLGLPVDRPIVMSGHQAMIWHPGILAKMYALMASAERHGACPVWLVVDHDTNDPFSVRYPARLGEAGAESLSVKTWAMHGLAEAGASRVPTGRRTPAQDLMAPADAQQGATIDVVDGLHAICGAMNAASEEMNAARQMTQAMLELLEMRAGRKFPGVILYASAISRTEMFAKLLEKLKSDSARAMLAYGRAVAGTPGSGLSALGADELPLWRIGAGMGSTRERVTAGTLDVAKAETYSPRAILMTMLLRWRACELFVHGTGGAGEDGEHGYDAAAEMWAREWLGAELAPKAVVSATVRLNFPEWAAAPSLEEIVRAQWLAHAAGHRPELLSDSAAASERAAILASLKPFRWKRDAQSRRVKLAAYRRLHEVLAGTRARHAEEIARLKDAASTMASARRQAEIRNERAWAFPLYEPGQLRELEERVRAVFAR
jgi:hypothetical protein